MLLILQIIIRKHDCVIRGKTDKGICYPATLVGMQVVEDGL